MIFTSNYDNCKTDNVVSISGDRGNKIGYKKEVYPSLAPKKEFWDVWFENIGKIKEEDNTKYYIEKYYEEVLSKLDPYTILEELDGKVLLCYEDNDIFCYRYIIGYWIELLTGIEVPEIKVNESGEYDVLPKPKYIKDILETIMKKHINMKGFSSLRAVYLYDKSKELEAQCKDSSEDYKQIQFVVHGMQDKALSIDENKEKVLKRY